MRSRLRLKRKYDGALIEEIIESLKRQGFLNDEKFAQVYAQSRVYVRPVGRRQLEIDLKKKGLSGDLVRGALEKLSDYDEKKAARDLVSSRFQKMTGVSREKKKARLYGFLKRRGFNPDTIFSVMADLFKD
ncbi:MAG: RecX family transcriptional regulator [Candidatus Omnitrophica bacterium]|nr:RecX family transcriptional regulator [Candidatus Omnitrophota bacterium]